MSEITKEMAVVIARKLGAEIRPRKAHDLAIVRHDGKVVAMFGIRRGSRKGAGHDHVPGAIFASVYLTKQLGLCPYEQKHWLAIMARKNLLWTSLRTSAW